MIAEAVDVTRTYRRGSETVHALSNVSCRIHPGDRISVAGRSGSGKSTLLHLLGALDVPSRGRIVIDGVDVAAASESTRVRLRRERIGFVFQSFHLIAHLSAWENVALSLRYRGVGGTERRRRAMEWLERLDLGHRRDFLPLQLSGGEAQRVAVARALVGGPQLVLADEPTGELDRKTAAALVDILFASCREAGAALVVASHDAAVAERCAIHWHMEDGVLTGVDSGAPN